MQEIAVDAPDQEPSPPSEDLQHREVPPIGQRTGNPISGAEEQRILLAYTNLVEANYDESDGAAEKKTHKLNELRPEFDLTWTSGSRQFADVAKLLANACRDRKLLDADVMVKRCLLLTGMKYMFSFLEIAAWPERLPGRFSASDRIPRN